MTGTAGYAFRPVDVSHGRSDLGKVAVSFGKVMPQTNTINLFTVTGTIVASLVGVISTALGAIAQHPTIGYGSVPAGIAAAPTVALNATAAGAVILLPQVPGAALPAPLTAGSSPAGIVQFTISNTIITLSSDASTTGNVTWLLSYVPLMPKHNASVVVN